MGCSFPRPAHVFPLPKRRSAPAAPREEAAILATPIEPAPMLWVLGSLALVFTDVVPLTTEGRWLIAITADIVLIFALAQLYLAWRMKQA